MRRFVLRRYCRWLSLALVFSVMSIAVSACGSSSSNNQASANATAQKVENNPAVKKKEDALKKQFFDVCGKQVKLRKLLTKSGREKFLTCMGLQNEGPHIKACVLSAGKKDFSKGKDAFINDFAGCAAR